MNNWWPALNERVFESRHGVLMRFNNALLSVSLLKTIKRPYPGSVHRQTMKEHATLFSFIECGKDRESGSGVLEDRGNALCDTASSCVNTQQHLSWYRAAIVQLRHYTGKWEWPRETSSHLITGSLSPWTSCHAHTNHRVTITYLTLTAGYWKCAD